MWPRWGRRPPDYASARPPNSNVIAAADSRELGRRALQASNSGTQTMVSYARCYPSLLRVPRTPDGRISN